MTGFDRQPILRGGNILLRPLCATDFDALFAAASDPLIWSSHPEPDRWQRTVFERFFADALHSRGALVILDTTTSAVIGTSRYDVDRVGSGEIEIGWTFLTRAYWGGQANAVVKALMIEHALHHHDRVLFFVGEDNMRSRRAMEKIGGALTDRRPTAILGGRRVDHVVYTVERVGRR